jgi:hypothetical protein
MTLADTGEIPTVRLGTRNLRFSLDDLRAVIAEHSTRRPTGDHGQGDDQASGRNGGPEQ